MVKVVDIIKTIPQTLLSVFFPSFCVNCGKEGKYICEKCYVFAGEVALICPGCEESSFDGKAHDKSYKCCNSYGLNGLASCWEYEGVVKKTLGEIKYQGITHAIQELVKTSFQMMASDQARFGTFFEFLFAPRSPKGEVKLPIITYVPMFLKKEKRRGFNQAKLIANEIARLIGGQATPTGGQAKIQVVPLLTKIKNTKSQIELTKEERQENIRGSFGLRKTLYSFEKKFSSLPSRVALVDDIYTTGATMKECCKVLKKAGVKEVWGFTLARTP